MWPALFKVGNMEVTVFGVVMASMFWIVSFEAWRKMKGDFDEEKIFMVIVVVTAAGIIGSYLWHWVVFRNLGLSIYGAMTGVISGLWLWCKSNKWNFWEWADGLGGLFWIVMAIGSAAWGPAGLARGLGAVVLGLVASLIAKNYRKIRWYKSGKAGFAALVYASAMCILELMVAFRETGAVYFGGLTIKQWIAVVFLTVFLVLIYIRSGRKTSEDMRGIWQKLKRQKK